MPASHRPDLLCSYCDSDIGRVSHKRAWPKVGRGEFNKSLNVIYRPSAKTKRAIYICSQQATVRIDGETSDWVDIKQGVHQGCILSPLSYYLVH
jgi:hypothetical protein